MIKFNWGHGIVLGIVIFIGFILTLVFMSSQHKVNLVSKDYYPKELKHQEQMMRIRNTEIFKEEFVIEKMDEHIRVEFPDHFRNKSISGIIHFFRPSDYEMDQTYRIELNEKGIQKFKTSTFVKGKYILKINWRLDDMEYYFEQDLTF
ncbi:MAG: FixH family protein [Bacteroidales bacterium]|nr:FixH family protein [Bacteroidales bacterium]